MTGFTVAANKKLHVTFTVQHMRLLRGTAVATVVVTATINFSLA